MSSPGRDQIRGWKEIAAYLGRDERTVKRWERQRHLPVRRIPGPGRANVYIVVSELEAWLAAGNQYTASLDKDFDEQEFSARKVDVRASSRPLEPASAGIDHWPSGANPILEAYPGRRSFVLGYPGLASRMQAKASRQIPFILLLGIALLVLVGALVRGRVLAGRTRSIFARSSHSHAISSPQTRADALYFEGVYFKEQRTPGSLDHALRSFEEVVAQDPKHARAYAGLATTYLLMREYGTMPQDEAYAKAESAAESAVALDPNLAEAHAALGFVAFFSSWNPRRATQEFESALQLDPTSSVVHHWYGSMLTHQGLYPEALDQLDIAQELEPTSAAIVASKAYALGLSGHREEAIELLQPLVTADRNSPAPHRTLAVLSLMEPRDIPRYIEETQRFATMRNDHEALNRLALASDAYQRGGEAAMWRVMLQKERELHPRPERPTYFMIDAQAALGQQEQAIKDMSILARDHDVDMIGIAIDPLLTPLRHNPGFRRIEAVVGLQPAS